LLKFTAAGEAVTAPAAAPVPASETLSGVLDALLVMAMLPVATPEAVGAKVAVRLRVCPALKVAGSEKPLILNPVPVTAACEMERADPPVLVRVTG